MKERSTLFNPIALMGTPDTTKKNRRRHPMRMSGGDIGGVLSLAVAMKLPTVSFNRRRGFVHNKQQQQQQQASLHLINDSPTQNQRITSYETLNTLNGNAASNSVSAQNFILEEKVKPRIEFPKEKANEKLVPFVNYSIIVDLETESVKRLKPQYLAAMMEEPKSPLIDILDPPLPLQLDLPLKKLQRSLEKLIIWKPMLRQAVLEAESLLAPIKEEEEENYECEYEYEYEYEYEEDESVSEGEEEASADSSSPNHGDDVVWPGEEMEQLSRQLKKMKKNLETSQENDDDDDDTVLVEEMEKHEAGAHRADFLRLRSMVWLMILFLGLLVVFRFEAVSCYLLLEN